jgi:hypothetical protein
MAKQAILPPAWPAINTYLELWHGCFDTDARNIEKNGIDLTRGRSALDFGRGFYTTTDRRRAEKRARTRHFNLLPENRVKFRPAMLKFRVPMERIAKLESLVFVRGDAKHDAFWSFVYHCRSSTATAPNRHLHPSRLPPDDWYDLVCGPIVAAWPPLGQYTFRDSDQFSFHTANGIAILEDGIKAGTPEFELIVM